MKSESTAPALSTLIAEMHGNQQASTTLAAPTPDPKPLPESKGIRFMTTAELSRPRHEDEIDLAPAVLVKIKELGLMPKYAALLTPDFVSANPHYQRHLFNAASRIIIGENASKWLTTDNKIDAMCSTIDGMLTQGVDLTDHHLWQASITGALLPLVAEFYRTQENETSVADEQPS